MQAFAGHLRIKTGRVQFLQMPVSSLILYSLPPDLLLQIPALRSIAIYSRWLSCWHL